MSILQVKDLSICFNSLFGQVHAVEEISFDLPRGTILGVVGESGCGKSVTSLAIMRLLTEAGGQITGGEIFFEGQDLLLLSERQMCSLRGSRIAMISQEPMSALNPSYTVYKQINEVYKIHDARRRSKQQVASLLEKLNIPEPLQVVDKYPFELSGGMLQRIVIAMAIALKPDLLIADEPTTALDVTTQAEILELLSTIHAETGSAIMLITHDLGVIAELAQRVVVMYMGKIVEESEVLSFFDDPLHPYTRDLLKARPEHFNGRFASIKGNVQTTYSRMSACPYAARCSNCMDICLEQLPPEMWLNPKRRVACWLVEEESAIYVE